MATTLSENDQKRFDGDVPELLNTELQPNARSNKKVIDETVVGVKAVSGATRPAGKSDANDVTLRSGSKPPSEAVREVDLSANKDTRQKACDQQSGRGDGNPKKRTTNSWGIGTKDKEQ
jgi:hypothetical protein